MFAGVWYPWIMLTFFLGCGGILLLFVGILFAGHWMEKRRTGAKHRFLELPDELRQSNTPSTPPESDPPAKPNA